MLSYLEHFPFNQKFQKLWVGRRKEQKFSRINFWNFGYTSQVVLTFQKIGTIGKLGFQCLSVVNVWKFQSETEWNSWVQLGWYNQPENSGVTVPFAT